MPLLSRRGIFLFSDKIEGFSDQIRVNIYIYTPIEYRYMIFIELRKTMKMAMGMIQRKRIRYMAAPRP